MAQLMSYYQQQQQQPQRRPLPVPTPRRADTLPPNISPAYHPPHYANPPPQQPVAPPPPPKPVVNSGPVRRPLPTPTPRPISHSHSNSYSHFGTYSPVSPQISNQTPIPRSTKHYSLINFGGQQVYPNPNFNTSPNAAGAPNGGPYAASTLDSYSAQNGYATPYYTQSQPAPQPHPPPQPPPPLPPAPVQYTGYYTSSLPQPPSVPPVRKNFNYGNATPTNSRPHNINYENATTPTSPPQNFNYGASPSAVSHRREVAVAEERSAPRTHVQTQTRPRPQPPAPVDVRIEEETPGDRSFDTVDAYDGCTVDPESRSDSISEPASEGEDSGIEDLYGSDEPEDQDERSTEVNEPPSPQYGILDLPKRGAVGHGQPEERSTSSRPQSMTLRFAALGVNDDGEDHQAPDRYSQRPRSNNQQPAQTQARQAPPQWHQREQQKPQTTDPSATPTMNSYPFSQSSARPPAQSQVTSRFSLPAHQTQPSLVSGHNQYRAPNRHVPDLDDEPPVGPNILRRTPSPSPSASISTHASYSKNTDRPLPQFPPLPQSHSTHQPHKPQYQPPPVTQPPPRIQIESPTPRVGKDVLAGVPQVVVDGDDDDTPGSSSGGGVPQISFSVSGPDDEANSVPGISISVSGADDPANGSNSHSSQAAKPLRPIYRTGGLICGGCGGPIVGRIVNAMSIRWHPGCFRCTVCDELLEHVSSYEKDGRPYCHLDYHENFAPRCYSCKTAIIEERFISLDDPALGKRTYHEQHFFCAECGDPFLPPSAPDGRNGTGEVSLSGDGTFVLDDEVGFTVYKGHPYCEACHVRLRMPKCKKCKKSIRDGARAVEALGGNWCWECFVCAGCQQPFEDPSFFQRDDKPYCERCFSIILRNEL